MTKDEREQLAEVNPEIILYDDLEDAFLGVCRRFNQEPIALYDYHKCIEIRMEDGASYEEASEFHEVNTMGAWVGEFTPAFLVTLDDAPLRSAAQERDRILARAKKIYETKGSTLHNPGDMIRFLIEELEKENGPEK